MNSEQDEWVASKMNE